MFRLLMIVTFCAGVIIPQSVKAAPVSASGYIDYIWASSATNLAYRIYVKTNGVNQFPTCTGGFVYMDVSDDNYQAKVANILTAYGRNVKIDVAADKEATGFCRILEFGIGGV